MSVSTIPETMRTDGSFRVIYKFDLVRHLTWPQSQLEQIKRLRSENTPAAPLLPILLIYIGTYSI